MKKQKHTWAFHLSVNDDFVQSKYCKTISSIFVLDIDDTQSLISINVFSTLF